MGADVKSIGTTTLKVAGAACAATGIVMASAIIASGAAVGAVAEGFLAAKRAVAEIIKKDIQPETKAEENSEVDGEVSENVEKA